MGAVVSVTLVALAGCGRRGASAEATTPEAVPDLVLEAPARCWPLDPASRYGDAVSEAIPHHDARRALHVVRREGRFVLLETDATGGAERVVLRHDTDIGRGAYLPDGPIVFSAATGGAPALGLATGWALFVHDPADGSTRRITFGSGLDADPYVLSDGRIVFSSYRPVRAGTTVRAGGRLGLFTVHPDGTGYAPFHVDDSIHLVLPVQDARTLDVFAWAVPDDAPPYRVRIDWDAPLSTLAMDSDTAVTPAPRRRPQGHLSSMKADRAYGTLVCVDARSNGAPSAVTARLDTWPRGAASTLGDIALADDGSFMALVPADTPLAMTLLDAGGRVLVEEQGPFWVRNNEVRVCVSCHDDVETGPPNRRPAAVLGDAVDLTRGAR